MNAHEKSICRKYIFFLIFCFSQESFAQSTLPKCKGTDVTKWTSCIAVKEYQPGFVYSGEFFNGLPHGKGQYKRGDGGSWNGDWAKGVPEGHGTQIWPDGAKYVGEIKGGKLNGLGTLSLANGYIFIGEFKEDKFNGKGRLTSPDGIVSEGFWENGKFARSEKISLPSDQLVTAGRTREPDDSNSLKKRARMNIVISHSQPDVDGAFEINIQTNVDTASLKINGDEVGGRDDGRYILRKFARAGQETPFTIVVKDTSGNTEIRTITVNRIVTDSTPKFDSLDPLRIRARAPSDSVAIIIGIQNYRRLPKADFAGDDARAFYDYAIRALGVKPENIKLLVDDQADEVEILAALRNWLPVKVKKSKTDIYLFYSGHGLPSDDGKSLYILPYGADKQFIDKTALNQKEIIESLKAVQAKSVTLFMDACYSGQMRTGDTLLSSARPISLRTSADSLPPDFTVFTASSLEQIASSSPNLKHGIFSYYLMKALEGDADENRDGRITVAELQGYLTEMVGRQAMTLSRRQDPQVIGDSNRILVAK
jgi:hypothetical protein